MPDLSITTNATHLLTLCSLLQVDVAESILRVSDLLLRLSQPDREVLHVTVELLPLLYGPRPPTETHMIHRCQHYNVRVEKNAFQLKYPDCLHILH